MSAPSRWRAPVAALTAIVAAFAATGCAAPPAAAPMAADTPVECRSVRWHERLIALFNSDPKPSPVAVDSVRYVDGGLRDAVLVRSLAAGDDGGQVKVDVHFLNCTGRHVQLGARLTFMDAAQRPLGKPSAWQSMVLLPHATAWYSERSMGEAGIRHFVVEVRDAARPQ